MNSRAYTQAYILGLITVRNRPHDIGGHSLITNPSILHFNLNKSKGGEQFAVYALYAFSMSVCICCSCPLARDLNSSWWERLTGFEVKIDHFTTFQDVSSHNLPRCVLLYLVSCILWQPSIMYSFTAYPYFLSHKLKWFIITQLTRMCPLTSYTHVFTNKCPFITPKNYITILVSQPLYTAYLLHWIQIEFISIMI